MSKIFSRKGGTNPEPSQVKKRPPDPGPLSGSLGFTPRAPSLAGVVSGETVLRFEWPRPLRFTYTNYRGETSMRTAVPSFVFYGTTPWHLEPQWFMAALDVEKGEMRDFALKDMSGVEGA